MSSLRPTSPALIGPGEGAKARLPEPPRKLTRARTGDRARSCGFAWRLRLACHDDGVHRRHAPQSPAARAVFDAVEQARVEAIGARRMEGVAANLTAMLDDRYHAAPMRRGLRPRRRAAGGRGRA